MLEDETGGTGLHPGIGNTRSVGACEFRVGIIDRSAVLTEADHDGIIGRGTLTLAREDDTFSCDIHLMNESLIAEGIDDPIEGCEIHFFRVDESLLEIRKSYTIRLAEHFDEAFSRFGNTRE